MSLITERTLELQNMYLRIFTDGHGELISKEQNVIFSLPAGDLLALTCHIAQSNIVQELIDEDERQELAPALKRANEYNEFILNGGEMLGRGGSITRVECIAHKTLRIYTGTNMPSYDVPYTQEFGRMYPSQKGQ
jgi:hypothetical protein